MTQEKLLRFAQLISIEKQNKLLSDGYTNILPDYGKVLIKSGVKYYVIILDNTISYRVDKKTLIVYDFYKKYLGTIDDMIRQYQNWIVRLPKRGNFQPKVSFDRKPVVAHKGYVGKIFWNSWGYDQTNNDFVQVVSETEKQVKVRKLKTAQNYNSQSMTGSERPILNAFEGREFILVKEMYRGEIALRGTDKSGSGSSRSSTWELWKGQDVGFSDYA